MPRLLGWDRSVTVLLTILAAAALVYSLIAKIELGAWKLLTLWGYLTLDVLFGLFVLSLPLFLRKPRPILNALSGFGVFALVVMALTQTRPAGVGVKSRERAREDITGIHRAA